LLSSALTSVVFSTHQQLPALCVTQHRRSLSFRQGVKSPPRKHAVFDPRETGYSSNIRPVIGYTQKFDSKPEYKEVRLARNLLLAF
jgi:hypothetical protein